MARYPSRSTDEAGAEAPMGGRVRRPQNKRGPCAIFVGEGRDRRVRVGDFPEARIGIRGLGKLTGSLRRLEAVHCVRNSSVLATVLLRLKSGLASFLGMWLAIGRLRSCPGTILDLLSWSPS